MPWRLKIAVFCLAGGILVVLPTAALEQTKDQIMYAAIFVCCTLSIGFLKVLAWVMVGRHSIKREIKRLELRIAELAETIGSKQGFELVMLDVFLLP